MIFTKAMRIAGLLSLAYGSLMLGTSLTQAQAPAMIQGWTDGV